MQMQKEYCKLLMKQIRLIENSLNSIKELTRKLEETKSIVPELLDTTQIIAKLASEVEKLDAK